MYNLSEINKNEEESPRLGILITTFLRDELLFTTLKTILDLYQDNWIILVADQGHKTEEKNKYFKRFTEDINAPAVIYYNLPFDIGLSAGRNFLVQEAKDLNIDYCLVSADSIEFTFTMALLNDLLFLFQYMDNCGILGLDLQNRFPHEWDMELVPGKHFLLKKPTKEIELNNELGKVISCDIVKNFFLARTQCLLDSPWDENFKLCFDEDTPIITKNGFNQTRIIPIKKLFPPSVKSKIYSGYKKGNTQIWTNKGWKKLLVVSRKYTTEKMYEIKTNSGIIRLTENHELVINDRKVKAKELKVGQTVNMYPYPKLNNSVSVDPDWAWLLGFFLAEGTCLPLNQNRIEITNQDKDLLDKCEKIFNKIGVECKWYIDKTRKDKCYFLRVAHPKILKSYFDEFYLKKDKIIPYYVFNFDKNSRENFIKGVYSGDGHKTLKKPCQISQKSHSIINGLIWLTKDIYKYHSISNLENKFGKWLKVSLREHRTRTPSKITEIKKLKVDSLVYDLECEGNIFCAGVGNIRVHNCEHETFFQELKQNTNWKVCWTDFCSGKYINSKPTEYNKYRKRMYSIYKQMLQEKYKITGWIKYEK